MIIRAPIIRLRLALLALVCAPLLASTASPANRASAATENSKLAQQQTGAQNNDTKQTEVPSAKKAAQIEKERRNREAARKEAEASKKKRERLSQTGAGSRPVGANNGRDAGRSTIISAREPAAGATSNDQTGNPTGIRPPQEGDLTSSSNSISLTSGSEPVVQSDASPEIPPEMLIETADSRRPTNVWLWVILAILCAIVAMALLARLFNRGGAYGGSSARSRSTAREESEVPPVQAAEALPPIPVHQEPRHGGAGIEASVKKLEGQVLALQKGKRELEGQVLVLERRIAALNDRLDKVAGSPSASTNRSKPTSSSFFDSKTDDVSDRRSAYSPDRESPPREAAIAARPILKMDVEKTLVDRINNSRKGDGDIRDELDVRYFSNDRTADTSKIFEADTDRLWLLQIPGNPDEAVLVPGLSTKTNWARLRQDAPDHPLGYHFDLSSGDKFEVLRPAFLRKNADGGWDLVRRGAVSGLS